MQRYWKEKQWKCENKAKTSRLSCYRKHEINAVKWKNWRNGIRVWSLQMGCNINERNVEARIVRKLGDTSQTHIHGSRKIRQQTRSWYLTEQEVEATNNWHWIHQRTGHHCHDRGKPPTHQTDECVLPPLGIWADTHSTKETKEVTGWCCKATQHSTRCTERHLRNKRPTDFQR